MAGGFASPVINAAGTLIRNAMKSINYVLGVAGWQISKNGNAEFNNGSFRGVIVVSGPNGAQISIDTTINNPQINFLSPDHTNNAFINVTSGNPAGTLPGAADLGLNSGVYTPVDAIPRRGRLYFADSQDITELAIIKSATQANLGGWIQLRSDSGWFGYKDSDLPFSQYLLMSNTPQISSSHTMNLVGETWHGFAYTAFWSNVGGANMPGRYRKVVAPCFSMQLVGVITIAAGGGAVFATLPVGYRPNHRTRFFANSSVSANGRWFDMQPNGDIQSVAGLAAGEILEFNVLIANDVT